MGNPRAGSERAALGLVEAVGLLRAVPHGVALLDRDGVFAFVNEAGASILAWGDGAPLLGRSWCELVDPEEAQRLEREGLAEARAGRRGAARAAPGAATECTCRWPSP